MNVNKVCNANCYIDGTSDLLGKAAEITLPEIATATDEHAALGMIGKLKLPVGLEPLSAKIKWAGFYPDAIARGANPFAAHKLQVRASIEVYGAQGLVEEKPLVIAMTGRFTKTPLGAIAPQTNLESEQEVEVTYIKVNVDGVDIIEIDVFEQVWKVNGIDIRAKYRANLGM